MCMGKSPPPSQAPASAPAPPSEAPSAPIIGGGYTDEKNLQTSKAGKGKLKIDLATSNPAGGVGLNLTT